MMGKPILCLDFDGVCHSYASGWKGEAVIPDPPVDGLFEFLELAAPLFDIQVYSSRSRSKEGIEAMMAWFIRHRREWRKTKSGQSAREILAISFPEEKPAAFITLDDRALTFTGQWPVVSALLRFKPWYAAPHPSAPSEDAPEVKTDGKLSPYSDEAADGA